MSDRAEIVKSLVEKARALPRCPGVYLMKDDKGRVLYIGKARVLPNRVGSYFQPSADLDPRKQIMLGQIADFDILECETEWEALLAENRLIKDLHPPFNVSLVDDKTFPYLVITVRDDFPGVYVTRNLSDPRYRGAKVFGPFTRVYALNESIKLLQRVFQFRTCELEIRADDEQLRFFRPCLLHQVGRCTAPCGARVTKEQYRQSIDRFIRFLESKRSVMLRQMREEMAAAAQLQDYERAAVLRDQISAIEKLEDRGRRSEGWQPEVERFVQDPRKALRSLQRTLQAEREVRCIECIDIAHLHGGETVGAKVCFVDGRPMKNGYRRYKIHTTAVGDDFTAIREVVSRGYRQAGAGHELYPELIIIDGGPGQLQAALKALADFEHQPPMVIALAKKQELIYTSTHPEPIRLGRENPGLKLCQAVRDEAHRFAQAYHHLLRKKKILEQ
jgi:excinuclease ABC subunit C